ncbi:hypothetical protein NliqN6_2821 [Naganishia liquefaciens]|uniref:Major facilitator superfamily (MFS) profile domain-containing protein n=1 Tax=Naganishia liquefaciens TaxID=104408 RepID=A0A8H3TUJ3_9TREE|nr:hypothetical protein NliqN6_2821 [Naganishia liquefaciens]
MAIISPKSVVLTVFIALVLDLLAFTLPLPLFPRLIDFYTVQESNDPTTLLAQSLAFFRQTRARLTSFAPGTYTPSGVEGGGITGNYNKKWDVVLLGGAMGSVFSLCQCVISPFLGRLSDKYGRKKVLLATMVGNILSAAIWLRSTTFSSYMLSRLVGGLSEGNVQLSTAIISDVTDANTRSKSLALIGLAFSICFTFGPSLGAYFASQPLPLSSRVASDTKWNVYAFPAAISVGLLVLETVYLIINLPETKDYKKSRQAVVKDEARHSETVKESFEIRRNRLKKLGRLHGFFLLFFSGAEFTLTFLTYDLFHATNRQNGMLLSYIGILSSLLQGGYVRRALSKGRVTELTFTRQGIYSCILALFLMAALPFPVVRDSAYSTAMLYTIATCLAYTSATCVTGMMAAAAACCDEDDERGVSGQNSRTVSRLPRGRALGGFRSRGQLGRAIGPMWATTLYWTRGPTVAYSLAAVSLALVASSMQSMVKDEVKRKKNKTN